VQFTYEEEKDGTIAYLDCALQRLPNGQVTTTVYRKSSDTNVVIKPTSCQPPHVILGCFKTSLCRAHRICSTAQLCEEEIENLIEIWVDNGHSRATLKNLADKYLPPGGITPKETRNWLGPCPNSLTLNSQQHPQRQQQHNDNQTSTSSNPTTASKTNYTISIPYIPGGRSCDMQEACQIGMQSSF
jgi:hypothetical protein